MNLASNAHFTFSSPNHDLTQHYTETLAIEDDLFMLSVVGHDRAFKVVNGNHPDETLVYFYSENLQADMDRVKALGGRIVIERLDVIGYGALGIFLDPMGKHVAFWQPAP